MIVVTGATGNVGRYLVATLAAAGERVTAVSRRISVDDVPVGVQHRRADLAEPDTLASVLDGSEALFLVVTGDLLVSDENYARILDEVKIAGIRRVVLLSSQAARTRPDSHSHAGLRKFEEILQRAAVDWTVLRPGGFASNTFMWAESVRARRMVAAPFGDVGLPVVDPADIADVAAAVLRGDGEGHAGSTYELTGPALISPRQRTRAIGEALGTELRFAEQSRAEARAQLLRFMPEPVADGTLAILGEPTADEMSVSPDVERVLGRPPRPFADWAVRNVGAFR